MRWSDQYRKEGEGDYEMKVRAGLRSRKSLGGLCGARAFFDVAPFHAFGECGVARLSCR